MDCPKFDFHIHTKYLGCANETMEIPAIISECERIGVTALAITDHLNTLDQLEHHLPIKEDIQKLNTSIDVFFGVELNFTGFGEGFAFSQAVKDDYGFQFAIGGIHGTYLESYDVKKIIDIQHEYHLKTCRDPLVDVLVHPYWFNGGEFKQKNWPYFDSMNEVPESYIRELGQTAKETNTAIEINTTAIISNSAYSDDFHKAYIDFLRILADEGVLFSMGSDAHDIGKLETIRDAWNLVEKLNLPPEQIWHPSGTPISRIRWSQPNKQASTEC